MYKIFKFYYYKNFKMCGIYCKFSKKKFSYNESMGEQCKHRGPDETVVKRIIFTSDDDTTSSNERPAKRSRIR